MKDFTKDKADICLLLEGTYPYVPGGVSAWTHDLIKEQSHRKFHIVSLLPPNTKFEMKYDMPDNVVGLTHIFLQQLPRGAAKLPNKHDTEILFSVLENALYDLLENPRPEMLKRMIDAFAPHRDKLGSRILLDSPNAWDMLLRVYEKSMDDCAFLDFFWSWRALLGGMYSVLLSDLPEANTYHALCTGYAGLFLVRSYIETGKPCIITEHGIYTNERRIEIASADWLVDQKAFSLSVKRSMYDRNLRDFWVDMFSVYSRLCYGVSTHIITLYEGNQDFQRMDGAPSEKMKIIPNHIDFAHFSRVEKAADGGRPTIALIGRVVPIKDVKTFIRSVGILKTALPDIEALIMGPTDEDEKYYEECQEIVKHSNLEDTVVFTGRVNIMEYLGRIDVVVLTSISEAQPLVILEVGSAGIPCVATDVGACREMIMGRSDEMPPLGPGGGVTPLSNPKAVAGEMLRLLSDKDHYYNCSAAIKMRVQRYYNRAEQKISYTDLYTELADQYEKQVSIGTTQEAS